MRRTIVLLILDGWGIGRKDYTNPIHEANPKNINFIKTHYWAGSLQASGIAIGLPWGEEGNSEVGHLTLGAGKVLYQHFPRISLAIKSGDFFKNPAFLSALDHVKKNNSALNLIGLLTDGNVHASFEHLAALIELAAKNIIRKVNLHLISDGRDSLPDSLLNLIERLKKVISDFGVGEIATISGRFYAMDRDEHWDRIQKAYKVMIGEGVLIQNFEEKIKSEYQKGLTDEFIEPIIIGPKVNAISENDAIVFFNFREDRMKEITKVFISPAFDKFPIKPLKNLYVATMTSYSDKFQIPIAFPPQFVEVPLGRVLAENHKIQLRVAETEKYAHVTYFFNGLKEKTFENEYRILFPSKNVARHDEYPEMMAREISTRLIESINEGGFDFVLANFANPDMIAHTGNYDATVRAINVVDEEVGKILKAVLTQNAILIITADHGNAEQMVSPLIGVPETKHNISPVPIYLVAKEFEKLNPPAGGEKFADECEKRVIGILSDVAPTILDLMGIAKPKEMTGQSLIEILRQNNI
jgi:2,3-bisphosphoglycerate-independent phosphoglycerate mutase